MGLMKIKTAQQLIEELQKLDPSTKICVFMETSEGIRKWLVNWNEEINDEDRNERYNILKLLAGLTDDKLLHDYVEEYNNLGCDTSVNAELAVIDKNKGAQA